MRSRSLPMLLAVSVIALVGYYVWPFFSVLTAWESTGILAAASGILVLSWLPVVYPAVRVLRAQPALPWRCRFVLVTCSLTFGAALLAAFVLGPPIEMYLVYVAPQLQAIGEPTGAPLIAAADFILAYWWLGMPFVLAAGSVLVTNYLLPRWERVVHALRV
jgi:hypothetical protein